MTYKKTKKKEPKITETNGKLMHEVNNIVFKIKLFARAGGGGFFYSKGTWGCATHKGILFQTF